MKNIKLSVLALTVFAATVVSAEEAKPAVTPDVRTEVSVKPSDDQKAPEVAPTSTLDQSAPTPAATPVVEAPKVAEAAKAGYFASIKNGFKSAYNTTKDGVCTLGSTAYNNKLATAGVVVAVAAAFAYRKQITAAAKKAINYAINNPVKVAAGAAAIAALSFAEYKLGYGAAALSKIASYLPSSKAVATATDVAANAAPAVETAK